MPRVKRGTIKNKSRRNLLKTTKGYRFGRKSKKGLATEAMLHAGAHAYRHRRQKKGDFRRLWQVKMNAATRAEGTTYSRFIGALKKLSIGLDRKVLAQMAEHEPKSFARIVAKVK